MSQKKVDAYKERKANREKLIKKEKMILRLEKLAALAVCIAALGWGAFSVYDKMTGDKEEIKTETTMDTSALDDYVNSLTAETEE